MSIRCSAEQDDCERAEASFTEASKAGMLGSSWGKASGILKLPCISRQRQEASLHDKPLNLDIPIALQATLPQAEQTTVLYLAYGSNLQRAVFIGKRGIKPISQTNVLVPELRLTFDLPGLPYSEPCFANSSRRTPSSGSAERASSDEKTPLLNSPSPRSTRKEKYHKDRWRKGLVGCVYELTPSDFAHVIATEGGGAAYQDILVDCYTLPAGDHVPEVPSTAPFKAHTLYAHVIPGEGKGDRTVRPDPSYAQPSARYLNIIREGAEELGLPREYRDYLGQIRQYTITTNKQRLGQYVMLAIFSPLLYFLFGLNSVLGDKNGRSPRWLTECLASLFKVVWIAYDAWFKETFGDGERTMGQDDSDEDTLWERSSGRWSRSEKVRRIEDRGYTQDAA